MKLMSKLLLKLVGPTLAVSIPNDGRSPVVICFIIECYPSKAAVRWYNISKGRGQMVRYIKRLQSDGTIYQKAAVRWYDISKGHGQMVRYIKRLQSNGTIYQKAAVRWYDISKGSGQMVRYIKRLQSDGTIY